MNENDFIIGNKVRLVAQCSNKIEGIDYTKAFALVARFRVIRMSLAFACHKDFTLYQMDIKDIFK